MREDTGEKRKKTRKKKHGFGYYLYAVSVLFFAIANIILATLLLTHVQGIEVTGTQISYESEILSWVREDPMTNNSLYTLWKFKSGVGKRSLPIYLEDVDVSLVRPWKVKVHVTEKQIIGCVADEKAYVYFDSDGLVLKKASQYDEKTPIIEGLNIKQAGQYKKLKIDNEKVFSYVVDITGEIEKNELKPHRIVWEDEGMSLYYDDIRVKLGKSNFGDKLMELPPILEKLEGKSGILQMEHYSSDSKTISFKENETES